MQYKLVVYVPISHADAVRTAMGEAGAGKFDHYSFCSFSSRGVGRFLPLPGAHPYIGKLGTLEEVEEERIEVAVAAEALHAVIAAMKKAHPYEEVAYDVYRLEVGA